MEIDVINNYGNQTVTFTVNHYDLKLTVTNRTNYKQDSSSRRRYSKEESCQIKFNKLVLLEVKRHIRPGETNIPELSWLKTSNQLHNMYMEDFVKAFVEYCTDPVKFLTESRSNYVSFLEDPWCFEHNKFEETVNYFVQAYDKNNNYSVSYEEIILQIESYKELNLKNEWMKCFHSEIFGQESVNS